jgi:hypothetical protein
MLKKVEVWCQDPRWGMTSRHEKTGPVSPCSVYMQHSQEHNLTVYIISGDRTDNCVSEVRTQLGYPKIDVDSEQVRQTQLLAAECSYLIHALVLNASFESLRSPRSEATHGSGIEIPFIQASLVSLR